MSLSHPLFIQYRNFETTKSLEKYIEEKARRLRRRHPEIRNIVTIVQKTNSSQKKGNPVEAHVTIHLDKKSIVSTKQEIALDEINSAFLSIAAAFETAERAVREHTKRLKSTKNRAINPAKLNIAV
ncbi:MAG: HPF/RaiA family ribosome-associated protein [Deltaproteobacteria bacterium]|nr:HPF/RaiA family ribosome-associated protein [Deltaproteobacteria bacterium]